MAPFVNHLLSYQYESVLSKPTENDFNMQISTMRFLFVFGKLDGCVWGGANILYAWENVSYMSGKSQMKIADRQLFNILEFYREKNPVQAYMTNLLKEV